MSPKIPRLNDAADVASSRRSRQTALSFVAAENPNARFEPEPGSSLEELFYAYERRKGPLNLSPDQEMVLKAILDGRNVFFTGPAGVGKSYLLKLLRAFLPITTKRVSFTASTGIAACNIEGTTVHSWAGVVGDKKAFESHVEHIRQSDACTRWKQCHILVIDEVSMIDKELFELLERLARTIRERDDAFGGIQLVLCGDFLQLPPVKDNGYMFESEMWNKCVHVTLELTTVFRQRDEELIALLNNARHGIVTAANHERLNQCVRRADFPADGVEPTMLFSKREEVSAANEARLGELKCPSVVFQAVEWSEPRNVGEKDRFAMCEWKLELKIGAQVVLLKNLEDGFVNGSRGVVCGFATREDYAKEFGHSDTHTASRVDDELEAEWRRGQHEGGEMRSDAEGVGSPHRPRSASTTGVDVVDVQAAAAATPPKYPMVLFTNGKTMLVGPARWKDQLDNRVRAYRCNIPLTLGWALTIHKCQGMTLDRVELNLGRIFQTGQAYVALSRVRALKDLRLAAPFSASKVSANKKVLEFYRKIVRCAYPTLSRPATHWNSSSGPTAFASVTTTTHGRSKVESPLKPAPVSVRERLAAQVADTVNSADTGGSGSQSVVPETPSPPGSPVRARPAPRVVTPPPPPLPLATALPPRSPGFVPSSATQVGLSGQAEPSGAAGPAPGTAPSRGSRALEQAYSATQPRSTLGSGGPPRQSMAIVTTVTSTAQHPPSPSRTAAVADPVDTSSPSRKERAAQKKAEFLRQRQAASPGATRTAGAFPSATRPPEAVSSSVPPAVLPAVAVASVVAAVSVAPAASAVAPVPSAVAWAPPPSRTGASPTARGMRPAYPRALAAVSALSPARTNPLTSPSALAAPPRSDAIVLAPPAMPPPVATVSRAARTTQHATTSPPGLPSVALNRSGDALNTATTRATGTWGSESQNQTGALTPLTAAREDAGDGSSVRTPMHISSTAQRVTTTVTTADPAPLVAPVIPDWYAAVRSAMVEDAALPAAGQLATRAREARVVQPRDDGRRQPVTGPAGLPPASRTAPLDVAPSSPSRPTGVPNASASAIAMPPSGIPTSPQSVSAEAKREAARRRRQERQRERAEAASLSPVRGGPIGLGTSASVASAGSPLRGGQLVGVAPASAAAAHATESARAGFAAVAAPYGTPLSFEGSPDVHAGERDASSLASSPYVRHWARRQQHQELRVERMDLASYESRLVADEVANLPAGIFDDVGTDMKRDARVTTARQPSLEDLADLPPDAFDDDRHPQPALSLVAGQSSRSAPLSALPANMFGDVSGDVLALRAAAAAMDIADLPANVFDDPVAAPSSDARCTASVVDAADLPANVFDDAPRDVPARRAHTMAGEDLLENLPADCFDDAPANPVTTVDGRNELSWLPADAFDPSPVGTHTPAAGRPDAGQAQETPRHITERAPYKSVGDEQVCDDLASLPGEALAGLAPQQAAEPFKARSAADLLDDLPLDCFTQPAPAAPSGHNAAIARAESATRDLPVDCFDDVPAITPGSVFFSHDAGNVRGSSSPRTGADGAAVIDACLRVPPTTRRDISSSHVVNAMSTLLDDLPADCFEPAAMTFRDRASLAVKGLS